MLSIKRNWIYWGALALLAALIFIPHSPLHLAQPERDASTYLYVGKGLLNGQAPYRDAWDHKQPLIYFINALGLLIGNGSVWGMWFLEWLFLSATGILGFHLLKRITTRLASFLVMLAALMTLSMLLWNYSTEELSLPFQLASLLCFVELLSPGSSARRKAWLSVLIGACVAAPFFMKQSLVAVGASLLIYFVLRSAVSRRWKDLVSLLWMGVGFGLVTLPILGYFWATHALQDYWDAAFLFNFVYSNTGLLERLKTLLDLLEKLSAYPGFFLTFALWFAVLAAAASQQGPLLSGLIRQRRFPLLSLAGGAALVILSLASGYLSGRQAFGLLKGSALALGLFFVALGILSSNRQRQEGMAQKLEHAPLLTRQGRADFPTPELYALAAICFPVTLATISLSGQEYLYYLIPLFPPAVLILGSIAASLSAAFENAAGRQFSALLLIGVGLASVYNPALQLIGAYQRQPEAGVLDALAYIDETTRPEDTIYVWSQDTYLYFFSGRQAPTRYFTLAPVAWEPYETRFHVIDQIVKDFQTRPPALFITQNDLKLEPGKCAPADNASGLPEAVFGFVCQHYRLDKSMGSLSFYRLAP